LMIRGKTQLIELDTGLKILREAAENFFLNFFQFVFDLGGDTAISLCVFIRKKNNTTTSSQLRFYSSNQCVTWKTNPYNEVVEGDIEINNFHFTHSLDCTRRVESLQTLKIPCIEYTTSIIYHHQWMISTVAFFTSTYCCCNSFKVFCFFDLNQCTKFWLRMNFR
jgi:hypothetical protein